MEETKKVSVVGLGKMGFALAKCMLEKGYPLTLWNRTPGKASELIAAGATEALSLKQAVSASEVIIICVLNYDAVIRMVDTPELRPELKGKIVINLTTGTPKEAERLSKWMATCNTSYLDGAILAVPEQMGRADATIFLSGEAFVFDKHKAMLNALAGNLRYLGSDPGASSMLDHAVLYYMYGAFIGFFQGVLLLEKAGMSGSLLGDTITEVGYGLSHFIKYQADVIQSKNFEVTASSINININAVKRINETTREMDLDSRFPELLDQYFEDAVAMQLDNLELASLIKVFRSKTYSPHEPTSTRDGTLPVPRNHTDMSTTE